jgi:hypothetical protein
MNMTFTELLDPRAIIALLALFIAVWSIISSRKHNRLTVRPYLYEVLEGDSINLKCGFYLHNKGLGPAIIKSATYYVDGSEVKFEELLNIVEKLPSEFGIKISKLKPGSAISKDEERPVIEIKWDCLKYDLPTDKELKKRISNDVKGFTNKIADRFGIIVEWESSYGEKGKLISEPTKA